MRIKSITFRLALLVLFLTAGRYSFVQAGVFSPLGDAYDNGNGYFTLTDYYAEAGMMAYSDPLDTDSGFEIKLEYLIDAGSEQDDADGMAFVFSGDYGPLGGGGPELGVADTDNIYVIELDTFAGDFSHDAPGDPDYPHIGLRQGDFTKHIKYTKCDVLEDYKWHTLKIAYSNRKLSVSIDSKEYLSYDNLVLPAKSYFSIAGGTGDYFNCQEVRGISIVNETNRDPAPSAASAIKASLSAATKAKITWNKVLGAETYTLYRKEGTGSFKVIKSSIAKTAFNDKSLRAGKKYTYKVVAVNKDKTAGKASKTVSVTAPGKVTGVKVTKKNNNSVTVKWSKAAGASGYQISMSASKTKTASKGTVNKASVLKKNLSAAVGKTYYYKVRAYQMAGSKKVYGSWSAVTAFTVKEETTNKTAETKKEPETNNNTNETSDWRSRMYQFIKLDAYKNKARWASVQGPLISSYKCAGCRAYAADFVAYVYGKRNTKSDPTTNKYRDYTDASSNGGKIKDITKIQAGDLVVDNNGNHIFAVIEINWETGEMYTAEGNVNMTGDKSKAIARVGKNIYRVVKDSNGSYHLEEKKKKGWEKKVFNYTRHYGNVG